MTLKSFNWIENVTRGFIHTVGVHIHRDEEEESEHNQRWWLNQLDALIKKAAGDISSHLRPLVCVCECVCLFFVCETESVYVHVCVRKCQWAIRQLVVCAGGHLCASQPPLTLSESQSVLPWCAHWQSLPPLYSLPLSRLLPLFVSLYTLHNVHLSPPLLLSCYYIVDNVIPALSGCLIVPSVTPRIYLRLPHPPFLWWWMVLAAVLRIQSQWIIALSLFLSPDMTGHHTAHTHVCYRHTLGATYMCASNHKERSMWMCPSARLIHWEDSVGVCQVVFCECVCVCVCSRAHTPITWSCPDTSFEPKLLVTSHA